MNGLPTKSDLDECAICRAPQAEIRDERGVLVASVPFTLTVAGWTCSQCTEQLRAIDQRLVMLRIGRA